MKIYCLILLQNKAVKQEKGAKKRSRSSSLFVWVCPRLLVDADDDTRADGAAAFTDSEAEAVLDGDRGDQLDVHVDVVAGHAHLDTFRKGDDTGNVGGTEVELRTVVVEERGVTAAFFLGQNVNLALELGVGVNALRSSQNLTTLDGLLVNAAQQAANVACGTSRYR